MPPRPTTGRANQQRLAKDLDRYLPAIAAAPSTAPNTELTAQQQAQTADPQLVEQLLPEVERMGLVLRYQNRLPATEAEAEQGPYDFSSLLTFEYQGRRLSSTDIEFLIQYVNNGMTTTNSGTAKDRGQTRLTQEGKREWVSTLAKPHIQAALHMLTADATRQLQINPHKVIREVAAVAFGSLGDVCDVSAAGITLKDFSKLPREVVAAVAEVHELRTPQGVQLRIKMHDKNQALNTLAKLVNAMPKEEINVTVTHALEEKLERALARLQTEPAEPQAIEGALVYEPVE